MRYWVSELLAKKDIRLLILLVGKNNGDGDVNSEMHTFVARLFWPYSHVKTEGIQKIIDHYGDHKVMNGNIVDLEAYKLWMNAE